eukprot:3434913-Amphidinium_carterae.1
MCLAASRTGVYLVSTRVNTFCQALLQDYKTGTPGDYGWKLLTSSNPAEKQVSQHSNNHQRETAPQNEYAIIVVVDKVKLAAELANGRLAMVAILAMFFQNGTVGTTGRLLVPAELR